MRIYLDNNATTPLHPAVLEAVGASLRDVFGNASSIHKEGQAARRAIEDARDSVAKLLAVDTLALSAHKLHAPKGIGALYVRRGLALARHTLGGAQERRRRAGTENVPLAVAFGVAAEIARDLPDVGALRDALERALGSFDVVINGADVTRIPNTSSVTFRGADAEGLVIGLDLGGV